MRKKLGIILLASIMVFSLAACGKDSRKDDDYTDDGYNYEDDYDYDNEEDNSTEDEYIDINSMEVEDYKGVTWDGVVFNKTLKLNGYEFLLPIELNEFLAGTASTVSNQEELDAFLANPDAWYVDLECYIEAEEGRKIKYKIKVMYDSEGVGKVREITISDDSMYEEGYLGEPNLVTCGFEFLDGYDMQSTRIDDLDSKYLENLFVRDEGSYKMADLNFWEGRMARDYWEITIGGTTGESLDELYISYVIVSTVNY